MTRDQAVLLAVGGLAVVCLVLSLALLRLGASAARTRAELRQVRERLEDLAQRETTAASEPEPVATPEFVITDLGSARSPAPTPVHIDGATFADIVVKEAVVKAASLAHGVRRGLAPATRNRIRFEMKQEVRRARRQRRADLKAAQRDLHTRQRAALAEDAS